ncbi:MAG TPA: OmpH family outer membrane protein [Dyella sp.]|nr:OmpH family outer membrane protein [Dyella sp.]
MIVSRSLLVASLITALGLTMAPVSSARAADELGGDAVPGLCMLSRGAVFAQSKVGQAASERLNQLATQARNQLSAERTSLQADVEKFQKSAPQLTEDQRKQQGSALQQRMQAFQSKAGELTERIRLTQSKVTERIGEQAQPIVASSYKSHRCGLLVNREVVLGGNVSNDLTPDVVKGLDGKLTTISFNLEPLPAGATSPSASGK